MYSAHCVALLAALVLAGCHTTSQPTASEPEPSATAPLTWMMWRPCGCAEGCAAIREPLASLREGMVVTIVSGTVRGEARPITPGTVMRVESAPGLDGNPVLVLAGQQMPDGTYGPTACGYLCQTDYAGSVDRTACDDGELLPP